MVRRDNAPIVGKTQSECCRLIFKENNVEAAVNYAKRVVSDLYQYRTPLSDLLITRALTREPHEYTNPQPHTVLVEKMRQRGDVVRVGDRIPHLMVSQGSGKVCDMAEDPLYFLEHDLPYNVQYYVESQLFEPLKRILEPVIGSNGVNDIFFGSHTLKRVVQVQSSSAKKRGIMAYMKVKIRCVMCKCPNDKRICEDCRKRKGDELQERLVVAKELADELQKKYMQHVSVCEQCSPEWKSCMSRDCIQLYRRKESEKKMSLAVKDIEDFV